MNIGIAFSGNPQRRDPHDDNNCEDYGRDNFTFINPDVEWAPTNDETPHIVDVLLRVPTRLEEIERALGINGRPVVVL